MKNTANDIHCRLFTTEKKMSEFTDMDIETVQSE